MGVCMRPHFKAVFLSAHGQVPFWIQKWTSSAFYNDSAITKNQNKAMKIASSIHAVHQTATTEFTVCDVCACTNKIKIHIKVKLLSPE